MRFPLLVGWHIYIESGPSCTHVTCCCHVLLANEDRSFQHESHVVYDWQSWNTIMWLTHWGRVTHICVGNLTIIGSDNGLSPGRRQAIIWTNAGILLIGPWETNFSEILISIHTFSFKKIHLKISSVKWRPFCLGLNVLRQGIGLLWLLSWDLLCQDHFFFNLWIFTKASHI